MAKFFLCEIPLETNFHFLSIDFNQDFKEYHSRLGEITMKISFPISDKLTIYSRSIGQNYLVHEQRLNKIYQV